MKGLLDKKALREEQKRLKGLSTSIEHLEETSFKLISAYRGIHSSENYIIILIYSLAIRKLYEEAVLNGKIKPGYELTFIEFINSDKHTTKRYLTNYIYDFDIHFDVPELLMDARKGESHAIALLDDIYISGVDKSSLYNLIYSHIVKNQKSAVSEWVTPPQLVKFALDILKPKDGESVYNPGCGFASFLMLCNRHINYLGTEINDQTAQLTRAIMAIMSKEGKIISSDVFFDDSTEGFYDLGFCVPPFGLKLNKKQQEAFFENKFLREGSARHGEMIFLSALLQHVSKRFAILLPYGLVASERNHPFPILIEHDWIDAIITLPAGIIPSTMIKTVLVVVNMDKEEQRKGFTQIINFDEEAKLKDQTSIDAALNAYHSSEENDKSLIIKNNEATDAGISNIISVDNYRKQLKFKNEENYSTLRSVLQLTSKKVKYKDISDEGRLINLSTIREYRDLDLSLDFDKFSSLEKENTLRYKLESKGLTNGGRFEAIDKDCVLTDRGLKNPTWVGELNGKHLYALDHIRVIKVDKSKINPQYLAYLLENDEEVIQQIDALNVGAVMPNIPIARFSDIYIPLPPLTKQLEQLESFRDLLIKTEKLKHELTLEKLEADKTLERSESTIVSTIRHNLSNKLAPVKKDFKTFKRYLRRKDLLNEPIRQALDEDEEVSSVSEVVNRIQKQLDLMTGVLKSTKAVLDLRMAEEDFTLCNIRDFLLDKLPSTNSTDIFNLKIQGDNPVLKIHQDALTEMFHNLIENAKNHAFTEPEGNLFEITISDTSDNPDIEITCFNSGKPFPADMTVEDFLSLSTKSQQSEGSGIGGYFVARVLEAHSATLAIEPLIKGSYFKFKFPRSEE